MAEPDAAPQLEMSTTVNDSDRGTIIQIVCWLCLVMSILFYSARLRIRWPLRSLFGQDDAACSAASVSIFAFPCGREHLADILLSCAKAFSVVQSAIVLLARYRGFGRRQDDLSEERVVFIQKVS